MWKVVDIASALHPAAQSTTASDAKCRFNSLPFFLFESFSNYIHPTDEGRIVSMQALDNVDGILTAQGSVDGVCSDQSVKRRSRKPLQNKQVAV